MKTDPISPSIAAALRAAVGGSGLTPYQIAKRGGFGVQVLTRWLAGTSKTLDLATADKIAAVVGLSLEIPPAPHPAPAKGPAGAR